MDRWAQVLKKPTSLLSLIFWPLLTVARMFVAVMRGFGWGFAREKGHVWVGFGRLAPGHLEEFSMFWNFFKVGNRLGVNLTIRREVDDAYSLHVSIPYLFSLQISLDAGMSRFREVFLQGAADYCWKIVYYTSGFFEVKAFFRRFDGERKGTGFNFQIEGEGRHEYHVEKVQLVRGYGQIPQTDHMPPEKVNVEISVEDIFPINHLGLVKLHDRTRRYTCRLVTPIGVVEHDPTGIKFPRTITLAVEDSTFQTTAVSSVGQAVTQYGHYLAQLRA